MSRKNLRYALMGLGVALANFASAQLYINNAQFYIQTGATVTVQGDVTSNVDIQGAGKVILQGSGNQNVNMGGFSIPNLQINNTNNVTLTGNAGVADSLIFTNGHILLGAFNLAIYFTSSLSFISFINFTISSIFTSVRSPVRRSFSSTSPFFKLRSPNTICTGCTRSSKVWTWPKWASKATTAWSWTSSPKPRWKSNHWVLRYLLL